MTAEQILDALRVCYDPQIALNVVDLGLVLHVACEPEPDAPGNGIPGVPGRFRTTVDLIARAPDEAARAQLQALVHNRLAGLPELFTIVVTVHDEPLWTPDRMSQEARRTFAAATSSTLFPILSGSAR